MATIRTDEPNKKKGIFSRNKQGLSLKFWEPWDLGMLECDFHVVVTDPHKFHVGFSFLLFFLFLTLQQCCDFLPQLYIIILFISRSKSQSTLFSWFLCYIQYQKETNTQKRQSIRPKGLTLSQIQMWTL